MKATTIAIWLLVVAAACGCMAADGVTESPISISSDWCEIFDRIVHFTAGFGDLLENAVGSCICSQVLILYDVVCDDGVYYVSNQCQALTPPDGATTNATTIAPTTTTTTNNTSSDDGQPQKKGRKAKAHKKSLFHHHHFPHIHI